jgi:hypothetical protein
MAQVTGTISDGKTVLFEDVSIDLKPSNPSGGPGGFGVSSRSLRGDFLLLPTDPVC